MAANIGRRLNSGHRKALIIAAAKRTLGKIGSRSFNITQVAREAGVAIGLIGHHFGGIEGLFDAMLEDIVAVSPPKSTSIPTTEGEAIDSILNMIERHFDPDYYNREGLMIWLPVIEHYSRDKQRINNLTRRDDEEVADLAQALGILASFRNCEIRAADVSRAFFALLDGLWLRWCYTGSEDNAIWEKSVAIRFLEKEVGVLKK